MWYAQHIFLLFFWLAMANSAVNPVIYFLMDAKLVSSWFIFLEAPGFPQVQNGALELQGLCCQYFQAKKESPKPQLSLLGINATQEEGSYAGVKEDQDGGDG